METVIASHSVSSLNLKNPSLKSTFNPSLFHRRPNLTSFQPSVRLQYLVRRPLKGFGASVRASMGGRSNASDDEDRWLLEPVGDGDSRHIGFKVALPTAFEIASNEVTVGRVPEKADIVIPVATVGPFQLFGLVSFYVHRLVDMHQDGSLLVTDLDSTNGTFIDEKRLTPGVPAIVPPGRYVTFGDTNLAIFRVSKLKNVTPVAKSSEPEPEVKVETGDASNVVESTGQNV